MMGPFDIGDRRVFSLPVEGDPYAVDFLVRYPDGTEVVYDTTETDGVFATVQLPSFEQAGTHVLRWNVYAALGDSEPTESEEQEFEVYATAFDDPFGAP